MTRHPDVRPAKRYDAFISYSRDPDGAIARELQYALQHVARGWLQRRSMRVFLDKTAMPVGGALWESLQAALDDSRYLVLIASPASASRPWVSREVAYWISDQARLDDLVIVLADGKIRWDDQLGDFDWSLPDNALPAVLAGKFKETQVFADFRGIPAKRGNEEFKDGAVGIAAKVLGVNKDDLRSEDRRQERRNRRIAAAAITVIAVMLVTAVFLGKTALDQGAGKRAQAQLALSRQLAASAIVEAPRDLGLAALLAVESDQLSPTAQARAALFAVLTANPSLRRVQPTPQPRQYDRVSDDGSELALAGYTDVTIRSTATDQPVGAPFVPGPSLPSQGGMRYEGVISHDNRTLAVFDPERGVIELWGIARHRLLATAADPAAQPGYPEEPDLVFSPDGRYLLSTGWNGAFVFSAATLSRVAGPVTLPGLSKEVDVAAFSPDGRYLLAAGQPIGNASDYLFSTANWHVVSAFPAPFPATVAAAFSPDGRQLALDSNGATYIYRLTGSPETAHLKQLLVGPVNQYTVAWNPTGSLVASAGDAGTLLWNPATGALADTLRLHPVGSRLDQVTSLAFTRNGDEVITSGADGLVTWQPGGSQLERQLPVPAISQAVYSPDGTRLATVQGSAVQLRNAATGAPLGPLIQPGRGTLSGVAFLGSTRLLAIGAGIGTIVWNLRQDRPQGPVLGQSRLPVTGESASPDGTYLAVSDNYFVRVWEVGSRRLVLTVQAAPLGATFSGLPEIGPDGDTLAVPAGNQVEVWDIRQRRETVVIPTDGTVNSVAFTSDGAFLAVNTDTPAVRLWNLRTRQWASAPMSNGPLSGDSDGDNPLSVDGDASLAAAASGADDSVTLWDTAADSQIGVLTMPRADSAPQNAVNSVAFRPDGRSLAVTSSTGDLVLWDMNPADWTADACALAGGALTQAEWSQFVGPSEPYQSACG